MTKSLSGWLLALTLCLPVATGLAQTREDARLITATQVLSELRNTPDQNVPAWLMERAYGVAVVPDVIKGAFVFGGRYGKGVMTVRDQAGRFGNPIFLTLTGGSVGWQIGGQSTDVVLVFATRRSVENFGRGKFTLGATASVAADEIGAPRLTIALSASGPFTGSAYQGARAGSIVLTLVRVRVLGATRRVRIIGGQVTG